MTTVTLSPAALTGKRLEVPLSKLTASRHNPRKVKAERDAHRRLVASIRAHGLLQPLVVQPHGEGRYAVIAGNRRLAALRELFKDAAAPVDPKIACILKQVTADEGLSAALAENFVREPMHPLDEAEAFATLAKEEGQGAEEIASRFGVTPAFVRQRMKLAALADLLKNAYREGAIDTGMAEAFAAVPEDKQLAVWKELRGQPRHAEHVRNVIANQWIDASHALFDVAALPANAVSRDLFGDRVLVEREAFLAAQTEALAAQRRALQEEGWSDVVVGAYNDLHDRLWRMDEAPVAYDDALAAKLAKLDTQRTELEGKWDSIGDEDERAADALQQKLDALDKEIDTLTKSAPVQYAEAVKAVGTAFLLLSPDGAVRRYYRLPRRRTAAPGPRARGSGFSDQAGNTALPLDAPPSPDDVSDKQKATLFAHQALGVRAALLDAPIARKRVLAMLLHATIRSEAIAVRHEANTTTLHAEGTEGFASPARAALRARREALDPFIREFHVRDEDAYRRLAGLSEPQLDDLIALLTVETLTAHAVRRTDLVCRLADELQVNVRDGWRPDAAWLGSYQKFQLAGLIGALRGPVHGSAAERRKKSELVAQAQTLFADAAEGRLTDMELAARVNSWLPAGVLTDLPPSDAGADTGATGQQAREAA
jgi:ParB family chromosome partitioning protein